MGDLICNRALASSSHKSTRDQQGFIVAQIFEFANDGVERRPVGGGFAGAAVDHQVSGLFGDVRIEIVHEHAQGGFLFPSPAAQ